MHGRTRHLASLCAISLLAHPAFSQSSAHTPTDTAVLQRLLVAEDARGTGKDGIEPLLSALSGSDTLLRRLAVRGLGRFQRPELGRRLVPLLSDQTPAIRAEAANAIAQSVRRIKRTETSIDGEQFGTLDAARALSGALSAEGDAAAADALAQSLGRLLFPDSAAARVAEDALRARLQRQATAGVVHGLYTLGRGKRFTGTLTSPTIALLRRTAVGTADTVTRRLALLTLAVSNGLDSATAVRTWKDRDDETRRMTLRGAGALSAPLRATLVRRALADPSKIVRIEAVAAARLGKGPPDCGPILTATRDRELYVSLTAIDSLASGCADPAKAIARLRQLMEMRSTSGPPDHAWQTSAHALLAWARLDSAASPAAGPTVKTQVRGAQSLSVLEHALTVGGAERIETRVYAARAAAVLGARNVLYRLAGDRDHNVQEAAITGLAATAGHDADTVYLRGLRSPGHQVSLAAAQALKGTADTAALHALLDAFDTLSAGRSENARDPRVAMLERIDELGSRATAPRLHPYLADYDTAVATLASAAIARWTGDPSVTHATPLPIRQEPLAAILLGPAARIRVTMARNSGGGSFTVRLFPAETPATVARIVRLVREGFYNGKQFQRVEPNFVIQGGGPDANEYVGDTTFMRDELLMRTHARGTLGISARGRDTGDGQWFINIVDNPLLDHEFTIFGRIDGGQAVAERILEGDRIERMEVLEARKQ